MSALTATETSITTTPKDRCSIGCGAMHESASCTTWTTSWSTLGDQVTLYPYGGHLGNLWYPDNKEAILKFFRP